MVVTYLAKTVLNVWRRAIEIFQYDMLFLKCNSQSNMCPPAGSYVPRRWNAKKYSLSEGQGLVLCQFWFGRVLLK